MCNYASNQTKADRLINRYNRKVTLKDLTAHEAIFLNAFGYPNLHVIKSEEPEEITVAKWGLVPSKINSEKAAKEYAVYTINAKSETIFNLPSYKDSIRPRRCLVAVTGFFEWMHVGAGKNVVKYPHFIHLKDEPIFSLGGIYDTWTDKISGKQTTTFTIVTVPANSLMAKIHNSKLRQPLVLTKENENEWLNPNASDSEIKEMMQPLDEKYMSAYSINKINPRAVDPFDTKLIEPFEYPELALL